MNRDILSIDDLEAEIRIGVVLLRRKRARAASIDAVRLREINRQLQQRVHALAGYPVRLALPAPLHD